MRITIIGAGNVGTALAVLLKRAGHEIVGIASRTESSAQKAAARVHAPYGTNPLSFTRAAHVVFLTTPDRVITQVCSQIAAQDGFTADTIVAHTSGAHSSEILHTALQCDARPISFHPLQTFANPDAGIQNLAGSFITLEGHNEAIPAARQLVADLSCKLLEIPTAGKPLYHAAACIACNYLTTLMDAALQTMEAAGIDRDKGLPALYPLIEGTLNNITRVGTIQSLTGPIARGDAPTVEAPLVALEKHIPHLSSLYKSLGQVTVDVASAKETIGEEERQNLLKLFGGV